MCNPGAGTDIWVDVTIDTSRICGPGFPKSGGRAKGTKNKRTTEVEQALRPLVPKAKRKLMALIDSEDDKVAYSACMGVLS